MISALSALSGLHSPPPLTPIVSSFGVTSISCRCDGYGCYLVHRDRLPHVSCFLPARPFRPFHTDNPSEPWPGSEIKRNHYRGRLVDHSTVRTGFCCRGTWGITYANTYCLQTSKSWKAKEEGGREQLQFYTVSPRNVFETIN